MSNKPKYAQHAETPRLILALAGVVCACAVSPFVVSLSYADEGPSLWRLCPDPPKVTALPRLEPEDEDEPIHLSAEFGEAAEKQRFTMWGNARAQRGDQELEADLLSYDKAHDLLQARGSIRFRQDGLFVTGRSASFNLLTRSGRLEDVKYRLEPRHARGAASSIEVKGQQGKEVAHLDDAGFTTCSAGDHSWYLHTKRLRLDHASGTGIAHHAWLSFKGVPVLYSPFLTFPLDDRRRSGFLAPTFGTSDTSGIDLSIPYYWNIAPNRDATFGARWMSKRGEMLRGEYRYLYPTGHGQLNAEVIPDDALHGGSRGLVSYRHQGTVLRPNLVTDVNFNQASDPSYFQDLGNSLDITSINYLERRGDLTYLGPFWSLTGRLQSFESLDVNIPLNQRPYARLPQLLFAAARADGPYGTAYRLDSELVRFDRKVGVIGERLDLQPVLRWPYSRPAGYITPAVKFRYTQYALQDAAPGQEESPTRTLPLLSVDSKLFFERDLTLGGRRLLQTLEPRLYYLYVPFRDQSDLPVFDTVRPELTYAQLFADNRFIGADRVGDTHQVTLGLTSRLVDLQRGVEPLSISLGQIYYFRDRRVTLPGEAVDTRSTSDLVGELTGNLDSRLSARATVQWNSEERRTDKSAVLVRYRPSPGRLVDLGYRVDQLIAPDVEQVEAALLWPVTRQWSVLGRWNYSLADSRTVESTFGFGYESCCWAIWLAARRVVTDVAGESNTSLFVQLELKGLTRVGRRVEDLLEEDFLADRR